MINTKIYRPSVTPDQVFRQPLIDKFKAKQYLPLTLVVAPAGYGKSVTISQWLDQTSNPNAWLSLINELDAIGEEISKLFKTVLDLELPDETI